MKISEKLSIIRRREGELTRLYELRESIAKQSFKESTIRTEKETAKEIEARQKYFLANKKSKIADIEKRIGQLTREIIDGKNEINKKNVEVGIDKKLAEIKYLRIELSKLMGLIKGSRYFTSFDSDVFEELGLAVKIKELEEQKQNAEKAVLEANKSEISWGSQIRSYVLDASRVKDLRTGVETTDTQGVLDGDIDRFIEACLKQNNTEKSSD